MDSLCRKNIIKAVSVLIVTSLCLRDHDFDFGERFEVSYAPYLHFRQRYVLRLLHAHKHMRTHVLR